MFSINYHRNGLMITRGSKIFVIGCGGEKLVEVYRYRGGERWGVLINKIKCCV